MQPPVDPLLPPEVAPEVPREPVLPVVRALDEDDARVELTPPDELVAVDSVVDAIAEDPVLVESALVAVAEACEPVDCEEVAVAEAWVLVDWLPEVALEDRVEARELDARPEPGPPVELALAPNPDEAEEAELRAVELAALEAENRGPGGGWARLAPGGRGGGERG